MFDENLNVNELNFNIKTVGKKEDEMPQTKEFVIDGIDIQVSVKKRFPQDIVFYDGGQVPDEGNESPKPEGNGFKKTHEDGSKETTENNDDKKGLEKDEEDIPRDLKEYFYTVIGEEDFIQGVALYNSIVKNSDKFHMWMLCMDSISYSVLRQMNLPSVTPLHYYRLEGYNEVEQNRPNDRKEYIEKLKELLAESVKKDYGINKLTYYDAQCYFYRISAYLMEYMLDYYFINTSYPIKYTTDQFNPGIVIFNMKGLKVFNERELELCEDGDIPENDRLINEVYSSYIESIRQSVQDIKEKGMLNIDIFYSRDRVDTARNYKKIG